MSISRGFCSKRFSSLYRRLRFGGSHSKEPTKALEYATQAREKLTEDTSRPRWPTSGLLLRLELLWAYGLRVLLFLREDLVRLFLALNPRLSHEVVYVVLLVFKAIRSNSFSRLESLPNCCFLFSLFLMLFLKHLRCHRFRILLFLREDVYGLAYGHLVLIHEVVDIVKLVVESIRGFLSSVLLLGFRSCSWCRHRLLFFSRPSKEYVTNRTLSSLPNASKGFPSFLQEVLPSLLRLRLLYDLLLRGCLCRLSFYASFSSFSSTSSKGSTSPSSTMNHFLSYSLSSCLSRIL